MILLGEHNNPRAVQGAADYLVSQGLTISVRHIDARITQVWVIQPDFEKANILWQEFLANPYHEKYLAASWQTGDSDVKFHYLGQNLNLVQRFSNLHWFLKSVFLLCLSIFISFFMVANPQAWLDKLLFDVSSPYSWWTPAIIHFGALHLIFNLSWWLYLGARIVKEVGINTVYAIFFIGALVSNWAQYILVDHQFGGLSGVVYGLLGFCWIYGSKANKTLISTPIVGFMLVWMVLGFADVLFISMANWAHLFGLLSGMAIAALQSPKSNNY